MTNEVLGIVPARAGSQRVDRKNLRDLGGKPLIAHTIEQVTSAKNFDTAIVSTEDDEIQRVASDYGAEILFERPAELATDKATNDDVVAHALDWFAKRGRNFDIVCLIPVTTPFREPEDIDGAIEMLRKSDADSLVGTTEYGTPPHWAVDESGQYLTPYWGEEFDMWEDSQSQSAPTLRHPNGAIMVANVVAFRDAGSFYTDRTIGYQMPRERSLDIDEPFDLELARGLLKERNE